MMKKRFIISLNSKTPEQEQVLVEYLKSSGYGWWHWLNNTWLIVDKKGTSSARRFRDELGRLLPGVRNVVFELRGHDDTWAGFGPSGGEQNMFEWIKKNWKGDKPSER